MTHLRSQHLGESRAIADDVLDLFGIQLCGNCDLHYSVDSIKNYHCRPGAVRNVATAATQQRQPQTVPVPAIFALLMTRPNQIPDELVDIVTFFSFPARTISEIRHSSVRMWSSVTALLLDGMLLVVCLNPILCALQMRF